MTKKPNFQFLYLTLVYLQYKPLRSSYTNYVFSICESKNKQEAFSP